MQGLREMRQSVIIAGMKPINSTRLQFNLFAMLLALLVPLRGFAAEGKDSPLSGEMDAINRSFRQLNRQYTDPAQKASSLELVAAMQKHATTARTFTPPKAAKMSGDEQAKYVATFHKHIDELLKELATLKDAIANDKADVAKAEVQKIAALKDSSHKDLGVELGGGRKRGSPPPQG